MASAAVRSAAAQRARAAGLLLGAVLLGILPGVVPAAAQDSSPTPVPSATPVVIPVPEIATRAEETGARLRAIEASLQPTEEVREIDAQSAVRGERIAARFDDHVAALDAGPALRALAHMTATWQAERTTLSGWAQTLTWYANELEGMIQELASRTESWNVTLEQARTSNAPPAVIQRIQETVAAIQTTRRDVERYRAQILSLQDRVAREISTCDQATDRIASYRKKEVGEIFVRDTRPLLAGLRGRGTTGTVAAIRNALRDEVSALPEFARRAAPWLLLQVFLLVALSLIFRQAQKTARSWVETDAGLERAARIFHFPYSSAVLVAVVTADWFYPWAPLLVGEIMGVVGLVPVTRIVRGLIHRRLVPAVYTLASFFLLDRVRDLVAPVPPLEQAILMVEMAAGAVVLIAMLHRHLFDDDDEAGAMHTRTTTTLRIAARTVLAGFVLALASGLLGYMRLAHLIGAGTLGAVYLATAIFACVRALDGLVAYALRARPLRMLRMVRRHRPTIQRQVWHMLMWLAAATWCAGVLYEFQLLDPIVARITAMLTTKLTLGAIGVTLGDIIVFAITIWLSFQLSRFVRFALEEDVFPKIDLGRGVPYAITSLVHYVLLISGTLLAFAAMGIDLSRFSILAGALGVGVGFGLQNIVNNFVSGLILLFERPVQVGDTVQIGQVSGEVKRIGIRSSTVRTGEGAEVIVPNASLIAESVTNWTLSDRTRRIDLKILVAYGSDADRTLQTLLATTRTNDRVLAQPEPAAQLVGFAETGLDFILQAWIARHEQNGEIRSELALAIYRALREAGIQLATPQREIRLLADTEPTKSDPAKDDQG
jgi:small-conductance mechanosensitive channel